MFSPPRIDPNKPPDKGKNKRIISPMLDARMKTARTDLHANTSEHMESDMDPENRYDSDPPGVLSPGCIPKKNSSTNRNKSLYNNEINRAQIDINDSEFTSNLPQSTKKLHIIAAAEDVMLTKLNPWKLQKSFNQIAGELENVDYIKSGALLATCYNADQLQKLLKTKFLKLNEDLNIAILVTVALTGQSVQGKVYIPQMDDEEVPIADLLEQLKPQGVINIRKFYHNPEKAHIPLYVLTFFNRQLPKYIKI